MDLEYEFDSKSMRYRVISGAGKGQFISKTAVDALTESYIEQNKTIVLETTAQLINKTLKTSEWENQVATTLKTAHINSFILGIGGLERLQQNETTNHLLIETKLKSEYSYLRKFSEDILAGNLSAAQIKARVSLYLDSLHATYETGRFESYKNEGYIKERRIRNAADSCVECVNYAQQSWQDIGGLPNPGESCSCKARCRCTKEYSKDENVGKESLTKKWGWLGKTIHLPLKFA